MRSEDDINQSVARANKFLARSVPDFDDDEREKLREHAERHDELIGLLDNARWWTGLLARCKTIIGWITAISASVVGWFILMDHINKGGPPGSHP